jgi:tRNA G18 (ribose-2'-O)-methylase SpoU
MIVRIDDPNDPRIAAYRHIRERDLVGRQGLFVAEGEVVLRHLVSSPLVRALSLLVAGHRLGSVEPIVAGAPPEAPIYVVAQAVLDAIAGFHLHRGLLGLGQRADVPSAAQLLASAPKRATILVLFGISNHDNMGGLFRNAAAFGAHAVLLDPTCCDPLYRKAIRVSVGAALITPFARFEADEDPIQAVIDAGFEPLSLSPTGAETLVSLTAPARAALLLGSEGPGLTPDILARTRTLRIPMAAGFDSLNVATTSGIALHQLTQPARS